MRLSGEVCACGSVGAYISINFIYLCSLYLILPEYAHCIRFCCILQDISRRKRSTILHRTPAEPHACQNIGVDKQTPTVNDSLSYIQMHLHFKSCNKFSDVIYYDFFLYYEIKRRKWMFDVLFESLWINLMNHTFSPTYIVTLMYVVCVI